MREWLKGLDRFKTEQLAQALFVRFRALSCVISPAVTAALLFGTVAKGDGSVELAADGDHRMGGW